MHNTAPARQVIIKADHEWDEDGEKYYSRSRIFARHVARLTVVYDEPARMDMGGE